MNKKSVGVKSGDRGGRGIGPPRPIRLLGSHMVARFKGIYPLTDLVQYLRKNYCKFRPFRNSLFIRG